MHTNNSENIAFNKNPPQIWEGQWQAGNSIIYGRLNFALYELFLQHRRETVLPTSV